jgi:hypothetical protein
MEGPQWGVASDAHRCRCASAQSHQPAHVRFAPKALEVLGCHEMLISANRGGNAQSELGLQGAGVYLAVRLSMASAPTCSLMQFLPEDLAR